MMRFGVGTAVTSCLIVASAARGQTTARVSVSLSGAQANDASFGASISADGRYVAFSSVASNLVSGDANGTIADIFVHDRQSGTTECVSVDSGGMQGNSYSANPSISADGRYVAFVSAATNLVPGDTNGVNDVFVHDRQSGTTERVSVGSSGAQGNDGSDGTSISADGRYVAFRSAASNLVSGDTNGWWDVFVRDRQGAQTTRVSVDSSGAPANGDCGVAAISADGRYVAFYGSATNLVPGDTNGVEDVFVHDRQGGQTTRVSVASSNAQANGDCEDLSMSADGRYVAFASVATNLVPGDTNGSWDIFVRDRQGGTTERVSVDSGGAQGNPWSTSPSISADGRYVAFGSFASNLDIGDTNGTWDVFFHDRQNGHTARVSVDSSGAEGNGNSIYSSISADGRCVAFGSDATNLVLGDTNMRSDVFVRDGIPPSYRITAFCFGDGSGISCPCSNTGQGGRGCDNSAGTGGALLAGSGDALLSNDTLLLTASNERPTAFSLFWQGDVEIAPRVFGDGLGCMGGHLKRMFHHNASGGIVSAPQGSDIRVSARSAAVGNPITPGTTRIYHVFYRDPDPNFCPFPSGATFNVSNGLRVLWGG